MNSIQENKLSMYYAVKDVCEKYEEQWIIDAVFTATYNLWSANIPLIETNMDAQTLQTKGVTKDKTAKREVMTDLALFMVNRLQSYANVTKNLVLLGSIKYTATDLNRARDNDVVSICNTILTKANDNAAAIESYGITAQMIADLQSAITAYNNMLGKPKVAKSETKTATENLSKLFKVTDDLLTTRMDLDIESFKTTAPDFYSQYKTARIVISTGGGTISLLGNITIAGSDEPIKGATCSFTIENDGLMKTTSSETAKSIVKKSAEKGKFRTKLHEGIYKVVVSKIGFKEQVLTISVANGETTNLKVELEKIQ